MEDGFNLSIKGHCKIVDDLGNVLLDADNAVHPQNMARIISRGLAREPNYYIHRLAFGNGGTTIDPTFQVVFRPPNDGQSPDTQEYKSRLYNEVYSEIVDDSNLQIGVDPGSADPNTGTRPGGGAFPDEDPTTITHVSGPGTKSKELGTISEVIITTVLNPNEPQGQPTLDFGGNEGTDKFTFDEIGVYTSGADALNSSGYQNIDVGGKKSTDVIGLDPDTKYTFKVNIDGVGMKEVSLRTPLTGSGTNPVGAITYGDLCEAYNLSASGQKRWEMEPIDRLSGSELLISDAGGASPYTTIAGAETYGFLQFRSKSSGLSSTIEVGVGTDNDLISALNNPFGGTAMIPVDGTEAGVQNNPLQPTLERERLLTHLIFSPITKTANRTLVVTYSITVSVARTTAE